MRPGISRILASYIALQSSSRWNRETSCIMPDTTKSLRGRRCGEWRLLAAREERMEAKRKGGGEARANGIGHVARHQPSG